MEIGPEDTPRRLHDCCCACAPENFEQLTFQLIEAVAIAFICAATHFGLEDLLNLDRPNDPDDSYRFEMIEKVLCES